MMGGGVMEQTKKLIECRGKLFFLSRGSIELVEPWRRLQVGFGRKDADRAPILFQDEQGRAAEGSGVGRGRRDAAAEGTHEETEAAVQLQRLLRKDPDLIPPRKKRRYYV